MERRRRLKQQAAQLLALELANQISQLLITLLKQQLQRQRLLQTIVTPLLQGYQSCVKRLLQRQSAIRITKLLLIKFLSQMVESKLSTKHLQQSLIQVMKFYCHLRTGLLIPRRSNLLAENLLKSLQMKLKII